MIFRARWAWLTVALVLGVAPGVTSPAPAAAQSLLSAGGLGFPVEAVGARSRGMGSLGVGVFGANLLPVDPASTARVLVPTITATYQPTWSTYVFAGSEEQALTSSRFPFLGVAYPVGATGGVATLSFSSFLDQHWQAERHETLALNSGELVDVTDRFRSDGGVSVLRLGWSQRVTEEVGVGLSVGSYLGDVERVVTRFFDGSGVGGDVTPFRQGGKWRYTGPTVVAGASWQPSDLFHVAGSVTWSGTLDANVVESFDGSDREIDLPTELRAGASGRLSSRLSIHGGVGYADWSSTSDGLAEASAVGPIWSFGGGVEWLGPTLLGRDVPIRVGVRRTDLPFRFDGADPTESVFSVGLGLNLLTTPEVTFASMDLAYETGTREAGSFSETFGRATFTVRVGGQ